MRSFAVTAAASLFLVARSAGAGPAPLDLAPFAMLEAAPFTRSSIGFSELDKGPGAVRDGDPATAWEVPGEEGETATLTLDWSTAGGIEPFPVSGVRIDIDPADAAIGVAAGRDRGTLAEAAFDAAQDDTGVTL